MIFIALIFLSFFTIPTKVFAAPVVTINNISDNNIIGENFSVDFAISNADVGSSFYYKIFGGIGDTTSSIQNFYNDDYLNYTSSWSDFPIITISTSSASLVTAYGRVNNDQSGLYNVRVRIAKVLSTGSKYDSESKTIDCLLPTPTPTDAPTPIPTNTPLPTSTPTAIPTSIPTTKPTSTPTPITTITSTPSKNLTPTPTLTLTTEPSIITEPTEEVLGTTDIPTPEPTEENKKSEEKTASVVSFIPTILIILGALLLFTPLILSKIKHCPKKFLKK